MNYIKIFLLGLVSLTTGCLGTIDAPRVEYPTPVASDDGYNKVYQSSTASFDVVYHFETKYKINITQLTQAFREAVALRYEKIFREPEPLLTEATQKTGFMVSLYASNRNLGDITDERLWTIQLKVAGKILKPSLIKKLLPKDRWQVFFPQISSWTTEYLVLFDQAPLGNQPDSIDGSAELILASPEGTVTSRW